MMSRSDSHSLRDFDTLYDRILNAYVELGYSSDLIGQWALPRRDAKQLLREFVLLKPTNVLEVGTFVGVSTLLMAANLPTNGVIHTIDPNFPLEIELAAMNTKHGREDLTLRHHEIAWKAAELLKLNQKIVFHEGGFSTEATFASSNKDPDKTVSLIGPEVCRANGPFELVFIDGLHYTDAVLGDLRLACRYLSPGGRIVVHDVIGMWGSNVRRAVYQFLAEMQDFEFQHGRYAEIFDCIGVLKRLPDGFQNPYSNIEGTREATLLDQEGFVSNLASIVVKLCAPRSAIYLGTDRGHFLNRLGHCGVDKLYQVGPKPESTVSCQPSTIISLQHEFQQAYLPPHRFDLCVSLGMSDDLDENSLQHFIDSCVACSDTILFGSTPPGEIGAAGPGSRPLEWWVREFWKRGYYFHDTVRPLLEPLRFAYSSSPIYRVISSELSNLYLIRREEPEKFIQIEPLLVEKDSRIEDLSLQGVYTDILINKIQSKLKEAEDLIAQREPLLQHYELSLAERDKQLQCISESLERISQSLEYRVARRLGTYPRLLRFLDSMYRFFCFR
jgi:predicted O-methyltransferase YrrM